MDGRVVDFDEPRGWGTIEAGHARYPFHCTALLDGTRTVEPGTAVGFEVRAGGMGRWEATRVVTHAPAGREPQRSGGGGSAEVRAFTSR